MPSAASDASKPAAQAPAHSVATAEAPAGSLDIQAQPPPFTEGIFPCSQCHDRGVDPKPKQLAFHDEIQAGLHHGPPSRWCLDCHDNAKRDFLHLINGDLVPFTESYRVCGQCHGDKYRDWRLGVHGKRVGMWNGAEDLLPLRELPQSPQPALQGAEADAAARAAAGPGIRRRAPAPARRRRRRHEPPREAARLAGGAVPADAAGEWSRRRFLQAGAATAALAAAAGCKPAAVVEELRRRNFKELKSEELQALLAASREEVLGAVRQRASPSARPGPMPGVNFGYGLDLSRCIGCRRCVYACVKENNQSRKHPQIQWIRVLQMEKEHGVDLAHADALLQPASSSPSRATSTCRRSASSAATRPAPRCAR